MENLPYKNGIQKKYLIINWWNLNITLQGTIGSFKGYIMTDTFFFFREEASWTKEVEFTERQRPLSCCKHDSANDFEAEIGSSFTCVKFSDFSSSDYRFFLNFRKKELLSLYYFFRVFHISISWQSFTRIWVSASLLKSPELISVFSPILTLQ